MFDGDIPSEYGEELTESATAVALKRIVTVAWLAVLLGLFIQGLVFLSRFGAGTNHAQFLATLAQGVSWAVLVCMGLAIGTVAASSQWQVMGLVGLVSGPLAWGAAKGVQRAVQFMLETPIAQIDRIFWIVTSIRGLEYAVLGAMLGLLIGRQETRPAAYMRTAGIIGIVAAAAIIAVTKVQKPNVLAADLLAVAISEIVFPIGCALVICAAMRFRHISRQPGPEVRLGPR